MSSRLITENDLKAILESMPSKNIAGEIKTYAGIVIPDGWLECDGSEVLIEDYPLLAAALGADHPDPNDPDYVEPMWGTPTSYNSFVLPDLTGRIPVGYDSADTIFNTVGKTGGMKDAIVPYHTHIQNAHSHYPYQGSGYNFLIGASGVTRSRFASGTSGGYAFQHGTQSYLAFGGATYNATATNQYAGTSGNTTNANLQPYAVVKYIICAA